MGIAQVIWTYPTRELGTTGVPGAPTSYKEFVAQAVWQYSIRTLNYDGIIATLPTTSYWKLDGNANDSIGTNHLTNNGASFGAAGPWTGATAASFDGIDDYLTRPIAFSGDFTINAWVYLTANGDHPMIATFGNYAIPDLRFNGSVRSPAFVVSDPMFTVALNTWNMITGIRAGSNAYLLVNGVLIASGLASGTVGDATAIDIGRRFDAPYYYFPGRIANVTLHPVALSQSNLALLYSSQRSVVVIPPSSPRGLRRRLLQSGHYLGI